MTAVRLPAEFYQRPATTVARALLGQRLVHVVQGQRRAGIIVETEAYLGIPDRAAHTWQGRRTQRNASMWLAGGHAYVYFTYGMHYCFNVVAGAPENPVAVLVRALHPTEGLVAMQAARPRACRLTDLCRGPARLCAALGITRAQDGVNLVTSHALFIEQVRRKPLPSVQVARGPRIGVGYAGAWALRPLRFWRRDDPHVSSPRHEA